MEAEEGCIWEAESGEVPFCLVDVEADADAAAAADTFGPCHPAILCH